MKARLFSLRIIHQLSFLFSPFFLILSSVRAGFRAARENGVQMCFDHGVIISSFLIPSSPFLRLCWTGLLFPVSCQIEFR